MNRNYEEYLEEDFNRFIGQDDNIKSVTMEELHWNCFNEESDTKTPQLDEYFKE